MHPAFGVLAFLVGIGLGVLVAVWLRFKAKEEAAVLKAHLEEKDKNITDLNGQLANEKHRTLELEKARSEASADRAAAQATAQQAMNDKRELDQRTQDLNQRLLAAMAQVSSLEAEQRSFDERVRLVKEAKEELEKTFQALSGEALKSNNQAFMQLAETALAGYVGDADKTLQSREAGVKQLVDPISQSLEDVKQAIQNLDRTRQESFGSLVSQVNSLLQSEDQLRQQTGKLVNALRSPTVRGKWGELQLQRAVELAGMAPHCVCFQSSVETEDGKLRPDLLINLPSAKIIVVDAKAPLFAYLDSLDVQDEAQRLEKLGEHARQIRSHIQKLASREYSAQFPSSPELVVLFLPGEMFFSAALEQDKSLIEYGMEKKVLLASPTTLIALLRAVATGWSQERVAAEAEKISKLGKELCKRIRTLFSEHFNNLRSGLASAVTAYNGAVGSIEKRLLVTAREFSGLVEETMEQEIETLEAVPDLLRDLQVPGLPTQRLALEELHPVIDEEQEQRLPPKG